MHKLKLELKKSKQRSRVSKQEEEEEELEHSPVLATMQFALVTRNSRWAGESLC